MTRLSALLIVCAALIVATGSADAATCADQIARLRQVAQLDHQPSPESTSRIQSYAQLMFVAELEQAEALQVVGNEAECLLAAERAKQMLDLG
jgi:hypothetical protein